MAGRPKSDDPTIAVMFRMKKSAHDWWLARALRADMKLPKLLQQVTENRAAQADQASPNLKGGKK